MVNTVSTRFCPLLERASSTSILDYAPAPWILKQCQESGFVYLENPPPYEGLKEEYAWEVTWKKEAESRKEAEPFLYAISTVFKSFRHKVLKRNKVLSLCLPLVVQSSHQHAASVNILDVGCGGGNFFPELFSRLPLEVRARCVPYGIEISKELARIASENLAQCGEIGGGKCVHNSALEGLAEYSADFFDLIVMSSFLEHEINPLPVLRRCYERLRPGGCVVVKVPNYACLNRSIRGRRWCGFRWPDHVNYFTPQTLTAMAQQSGLEVARMSFLDKHPLSDSMYAIFRKPLLARMS
jgi:2-polyprenyl-3-methyl-5-hydroxy-6-metoxy-1,4-benzoquinol methylase